MVDLRDLRRFSMPFARNLEDSPAEVLPWLEEACRDYLSQRHAEGTEGTEAAMEEDDEPESV